MIKWFVIGLLIFLIVFPRVAKSIWDSLVGNVTGMAAVKGATVGVSTGRTNASAPAGGMITGFTNVTAP